jgi:hypothetical protein
MCKLPQAGALEACMTGTGHADCNSRRTGRKQALCSLSYVLRGLLQGSGEAQSLPQPAQAARRSTLADLPWCGGVQRR